LNEGTRLRSFPEKSGFVSALIISPDGLHAVTGRDNGTSQLWDISSGSLVREFDDGDGGKAVTTIAVTPDGRHIVFGFEDNKARVWSLVDGKPVRKLEFTEGELRSLAITPDGRQIVTGGWLNLGYYPFHANIGVWDLATGDRVRIFRDSKPTIVGALTITKDGKRILSGDSDNNVELRDLASGKLLRQFGAGQGPVTSVAVSSDGQYIASASGNLDGSIRLWNFASGELLRKFAKTSGFLHSIAFTPDSRYIISAVQDGGNIGLSLWDIETGLVKRRFSQPAGAFTLTPDGRYIISADQTSLILMWDIETDKVVQKFADHRKQVYSVAVTPDGRRLVSGSADNTIKVWDIESGKMLRSWEGGNEGWVTSVAVTPDGKRIVSASTDDKMALWDLETGTQIVDRSSNAGGSPTFLAITPDSHQIVSINDQQKHFTLWSLETGWTIRTFSGHQGDVTAVAETPDGKRFVSGSEDGTVRIWDLASGRELALLASDEDGGTLALTRQGFFSTDTDGKGTSYLKIVDGMRPYDIGQFYQAMYRPELVAELLKGDPSGKYEAAAAELNLRKILDSGPAPRLELKRTHRLGEKVRMTVEITNDGGGIGKVEWRVNGVLQEGERAGAVILEDEQVQIDERSFPLTAGGNEITVTAYNRAGLITSPLLVAKVDGRGIAASDKSQLHILAIGIDAYAQDSLRLNYAVNDAKEFSESLKKAAEGLGLFSAVSVRTLLNEDVTRAGLDKAFSEMAATIKPEDKFVFFAAGHAKVYRNNYYFFPQNLQFGGGDAISTQGIAQDTWQSWFSRIPARASVLIYDTCEAGQLTTAMRGTEDIATAIDLLKHATGRSILAATTAEDAAREGFEGHGVFTYSLLQALSGGDLNGDGQIEIIELGQFVERMVPELSSQRWGVTQRPRFTIQANFPIASPIAVTTGTTVLIPKEPTHVVIKEARIALEERGDSSREASLAPGTTVRLLKTDGKRALVARNGQKLGFVPIEALLVLQ
jgi:WD40 repeat protein/uncharacterized caspase-like protein